MAVFNPDIPDVQAPNFTSRSEGIRDSRVGETILGNASDLIHGYVKYRDEQIQEDIYDDTVSQTESIQKPYIDALQPNKMTGAETQGLFSDGQASGAGAVPAELRTGAANIARLQSAYDNGTVRDAYYHNQLFAMVKGLRAKYGEGYNKHIDAIVQNVTGITPANALMADFFQESAANAAANKSEADKWQTWVNSNDQYIRLTAPDYWTNPEKYSTPQARANLQLGVASVKADDANWARVKQQLETNKMLGENTADQSYATAIGRANQQGNRMVDTLGNVDQGFVQLLSKAQANPGTVDAKTIAEINQRGSQILLMQQQATEAWLNEPLNASGETLVSRIHDPAKLDAIRKAATQPIQNVLENINNKDYGLAYRNINASKYMLDERYKTLLEKFPEAATLEMLKRSAGETAVGAWLADGNVSNFQGFLANTANLMAHMGTGKSADTFVSTVTPDLHTEANPGGIVEPSVITQHLDSVTRAIQDPSTPPEAIANDIEYLYGGANMNFLNNFKIDQQTTIYSRLTNPALSVKIHDLAKDNPQLWTNYVQWSTANFSNLFLQRMADVDAAIRNPDYAVQWNPVTTQLQLVGQGDNSALSMWGGGYIPGSMTPNAQAQKAVSDLNLQLTSIKTIIELSGQEPNVAILQLLRVHGVDFNAPDSPTFGAKLGQAMIHFRDYIAGKAGTQYGSREDQGEPDQR